jgi:hypothetical protein
MEWNLSKRDQEMIAARKNFKYEDTFSDLNEALEAARERSTKSLAVIYTVQDNNEGTYVNSAHGVLKIGQKQVAAHKGGVKINWL